VTTRDVRPLTPDDLPELSRFLTAGFHAPADAPFASPEVLRWKYLRDDRPDGEPLSHVARDEAGSIVGHLGTCRTRFLGRGIESPVETLHMIDWLGSREHPSVGANLMRRAHAATPMQFGLGGSYAGRTVGERGGYALIGHIPVYQKVLRPGYWLRAGGLSTTQRWPRLAREILRLGNLGRASSNATIRLRPVESFGEEILPIINEYYRHAITTDRSSDRLNAFLGFPGQAMTGWHLVSAEDQLRGFAVLNIIPQDGGATRIGRVVDCMLDTVEIDPWYAAIVALTDELKRQGADVAQVYAGTHWLVEALERAGYSTRFALDFRLRDRGNLVPRDSPFHLTAIEADYAYT
jgi:hypothetical protein